MPASTRRSSRPRSDPAEAQVDAAKAAVLNQQASVERARADLGNARAAQAVARAPTAKGQVSVVDTQRDLGRKRDLRIKGFIAQADEDAAQAVYDSSMAQHDANKAQEQAQAAGVRSAEAALKVTEAQLLSAIAQVGQNEAGLRQAQLDLEHTIIRAPVDGVVVSRTVDVGQTVAASLQAPTLFTIAQDLTKMQVDTNVDEADVSRVKVGLRASFTVDAFPGQLFTGEIVQIRKAPQVVQNVVTYDVVVSAQNTDQKLLPGMTANVRIVTERKEDALRVPNAALRFRPPGVEVDRTQRSGGGPGGGGPGGGGPGGGRGAPGSGRGGGPGLPGRVFILGADGKPEPVQIRLGISDGTNTEVVEGPLKDKQEVIVGATTSPRPASGPARPQALVMAPALIEAEGIVKDYILGTRKVHALRGVSVLISSGEAGGRDGAVWLGKVHLHERGRLPRSADQRLVQAQRRGGCDAQPTRPRPDVRGPRAGLHLPELSPVAQNGRFPSPTSCCRCCTAACRPDSGTRALAAPLRAVGSGPAVPPPAEGDVGRSAAAHGHRAGGGEQPERHPGRRADRRARQPHQRGNHGDLAATSTSAGHHLVIVTHEPDVARYAGRNLTFRDGRLIKDEAAAITRCAPMLATLPPEEQDRGMPRSPGTGAGGGPRMRDRSPDAHERPRARIAIRALRVNKLRSALTMLGIVIGVGAVITMVSVGAGAQARVAEQIASLGSNMIVILSGSVTEDGVRIGSGSQLTITEDDAWAIQREIPLVEAAAPSVRGPVGQVVYGNLNWGTVLQGVTPEYFTAREWGIARRPTPRPGGRGWRLQGGPAGTDRQTRTSSVTPTR